MLTQTLIVSIFFNHTVVMGEVGSVLQKTGFMTPPTAPLCISERAKQMTCFSNLVHFNTSKSFSGKYAKN